jgi:hypothetical protein
MSREKKTRMRGSARKCVVKDCENRSDQGRFKGEMCLPCYNFVVLGKGEYSQAYRNFLAKLRITVCTKLVSQAWKEIGKLDPTGESGRPPTFAELSEMMVLVGRLGQEPRGSSIADAELLRLIES